MWSGMDVPHPWLPVFPGECLLLGEPGVFSDPPGWVTVLRYLSLKTRDAERDRIAAQQTQRPGSVAVPSRAGQLVQYETCAEPSDWLRSSQTPTRPPVPASRTANARRAPPDRHCAAHLSNAARALASVDRSGHQPNRRVVSSSSPRTCGPASSATCWSKMTPPIAQRQDAVMCLHAQSVAAARTCGRGTHLIAA